VPPKSEANVFVRREGAAVVFGAVGWLLSPGGKDAFAEDWERG